MGRRRLVPGALRCFAAWVVGASRRLMPGALRCFAVLCGALRAGSRGPVAVLCGLGRGSQSASQARCPNLQLSKKTVFCGSGRGAKRRLVPGALRCFAVLCGLGQLSKKTVF